ncbi:hypothetical protein SUS17_1162 [Sphingomonas sp. S17]|nr:hypothetical protein SUS17_1162 [Sphingomonas sp. S17]
MSFLAQRNAPDHPRATHSRRADMGKGQRAKEAAGAGPMHLLPPSAAGFRGLGVAGRQRE